ncbi:Predicted arabinose efflux permease, MFS family [Austwickia chelonae]|uniref:Putative major facilitator superfamily transporter n=1 Tax=Austwickia chelonae NBRC 105200 TaxID=1184607 RepID=K6VNL0_9MICO|nr:putative major facilitator superfamily transporter [Austwickia chelonae NBRC 105200]SEW32861.1 Predicted arabinose efflux permease, MFS family [Austwickia chelonae]
MYAPVALSGIGLGAVAPVLPLSALALGASPAQAAMVLTLETVGSLGASLPASVFTARVGERVAMTSSALFSAVLLALMAGCSQLWALMVLVLLLGAGMVVFGLARQTYLTEAVPASHRARALSTLSGVMRVGMFVGPLSGAGLLGVAGRPAVFALAAGSMAVTAGLSWLLPPLPVGARSVSSSAGPGAEPGEVAGSGEGPSGRVRIVEVVRDHRWFYATSGVGILLLAAVRSARQSVVPLWGHHLGLQDAEISLIVALSWGVDTLLFYPGGWLMDRYGRRAAAVPMAAVMTVAFALLPLADGFSTLVAAAALVAVGNGLGSGIVMTISADASPDRGRPQFLGVCRFLSELGAVGGPGAVAVSTAVVSLSVGIWVVSALALACGVVFAFSLSGRRGGVVGGPTRVSP